MSLLHVVDNECVRLGLAIRYSGAGGVAGRNQALRNIAAIDETMLLQILQTAGHFPTSVIAKTATAHRDLAVLKRTLTHGDGSPLSEADFLKPAPLQEWVRPVYEELLEVRRELYCFAYGEPGDEVDPQVEKIFQHVSSELHV